MTTETHDEHCERLPNFGLCHCRKRERLARGLTELPSLWVSYPTCSGCLEEVEFDGDAYVCPRCHVSWGTRAFDGDIAERFDDDYDENGETLAEHRAAWIEKHGASA